MNDKNTGNVDPYGVICAYGCPPTDFEPQLPQDWIDSFTPAPIKQWSAKYEVSGDTIIFYGIDTPEKRMKLIEAYEKLREL